MILAMMFSCAKLKTRKMSAWLVRESSLKNSIRQYCFPPTFLSARKKIGSSICRAYA